MLPAQPMRAPTFSVVLPRCLGCGWTRGAARWVRALESAIGIAWLLSGLPVGSCWAADQRLNILAEEWAPYSYVEDGEVKGLSVDVVQALSRTLQVPLTIELLPSMRATMVLDRQPRTMMISMLRTPEREPRYKWIGPLAETSIYFYKRKGSVLEINSLEDAKKVPLICSRQAGLAVSRLKAAGFANLNARGYDGPSVYRMLLFGRCDLAVSDTPLGVVRALQQMGFPPDAVVQTPLKLLSLPLYIACSKDIPDAEIERWQAALAALKQSGAFQAMLRKYGE